MDDTQQAPPAAAKHQVEPPKTRDRHRPIKVLVSTDERAELERRAAMAGLPLSTFLRSAGLGHPIRSTYDYDAVRELAKVAGDLGRLGGLMKLWLSEARGEGASVADVNKVLKEARALQDEIRQRMGRL